jgi:hypothetical protein
LTLSLARSAYTGGDPRELLTHELAGEQTLRVHLLDQVLVAAYPDQGERDHATYWLGWLAHNMNTQPSGPTRDLSWWQIPGWITRWQVGLAGGLLGWLVGSLVGGLLGGIVFEFEEGFEYSPTGGLVFTLVVGLGGGLVIGLVTGLVSGLGVRGIAPRSMTIRRPTRRDLRRGRWVGLRVGLGIGLLVGLMVGLTEGLMSGPDPDELKYWLVFGLKYGLGFGLVFALVAWLVDVWRIPLAATLDATPRSVFQRDVRSQLVGGLMGGLACVLGFGLLLGLIGLVGVGAGGLLEGVLSGLVTGLVFGLLVGPLFVLIGGAAPSLRLTEIALRLKGRRVRFMPLLEIALVRQVLRQAGAVYQFRHADLQDRLADRYEAGPMRRRAT